jgi:hypothetical protein
MKRYLRIVWLCMLVLSMAVGAQAAPVTWDVGSMGVSATYAIPTGGNAAYFAYFPPYSTYDHRNGGNENSSILGLPAESTTAETFGANPGVIEFYTMGGGYINGTDGVVNQVVAQITQTDMDGNHYINGGHQKANSTLGRSFSADPGSQVTVSAEITGIIDWVLENWDSGPIDPWSPYSGYQISATISLLPMSLSGSYVSADIPDPIILDADHLSDSITFIADPDMDIFYRLSAAISIDTWLENWDGASMPTYPLPGGGSLGIEGDPLLMTTTVSQSPVPIPGTLVLLLSGCLSLAALRKRRSA